MTAINAIKKHFNREVHIAPLVVFRIAFGLLMFASTLRFMLMGWVDSVYVQPKVFFPFYGFSWVRPLGETGMYVLFGLMLITSLCITFGLFYRISAILFFVVFTYVELIDKTNYLNHYYFVSLTAFILCFLPAHHFLSLDNRLLRIAPRAHVNASAILVIKLQLAVLYFFAGVAKLNSEWLIDAMPLKIWLRAFTDYPIIGPYMEEEWVAYLFSWFGCIYDLTIPFLLFNKRTTLFAYFLVIVFHVFTALFFNIGMFPYIMMVITLIFFPERFHIRIVEALKNIFSPTRIVVRQQIWKPSAVFKSVFILFFVIQLILPFRYLLYNGELFWTEQGYRFSWRVMLMEKAGTAFFYVKDEKSQREIEVDNCDFLTPYQQKMMSTQPDMLLDYAHFLKSHYAQNGFKNPEVRVKAFVTLNGRPSQLLVDPNVNLAEKEDNFSEKDWILPFKK